MEAEHNPALRRALARDPISAPGIASRYLRWLDNLKPCPYVLHGRVSSLSQGRRGNLPPQVSSIRDAASARGFTLLEIVEEEEPGWRDGMKFNRYELEYSIELARLHDAIVLFETTDRAIRPFGFNSRIDGGQQPTEFEYELLMKLADGVPLVTVHHPDLDWREVRALQTRRGQRGKDRVGGRPAKCQPGAKKLRHEDIKPRAERLRAQGYSRADLASLFGLSESTLRNWIRKWK